MTTTAPVRSVLSDATDRSPRPLAFSRTLAVEARKLVNTTAGLVLAIATLPLMAVFALGRALSPAPDTTLTQVMSVATLPANWILMVLAVLLISTEFTRTGAVTFTLDPARGRVLAAKAAAVVGVALFVTLAAFALGAASGGVALAAGGGVPMTFDAGRLALIAGALTFTGLTALAWGLLTRNAPAPIVVLLLWPTLAMLVRSLSDAAAAVIDWINIDAVFALTQPTPTAWAQLGTSVLFWIVVPGALGAWRLLRGDL